MALIIGFVVGNLASRICDAYLRHKAITAAKIYALVSVDDMHGQCVYQTELHLDTVPEVGEKVFELWAHHEPIRYHITHRQYQIARNGDQLVILRGQQVLPTRNSEPRTERL